MSKPKLQKFAEVKTFENVFQNFDYHAPHLISSGKKSVDLKGKWQTDYFKNQNPLVVELACGRGEYSLAMARKDQQKNYIGVDIKGARIWKGAKMALEENLKNVAFIRCRIEQLAHFIADGEIAEIWITFPDPFPRKSDAKKRLTSSRFLKLYRQLCKNGSLIHLKTDNLPLFNFSKENIESEGFKLNEVIEDIYSKKIDNELLSIKTYYENMHLLDNRTINYLNFSI